MAALQTSQKPTQSKASERGFIDRIAEAALYLDQNRSLVYGVLGGIVVLGLAIAGYAYYINQQQAEAERMLAQIVRTYELGNYQEALDGTDGRMGLTAIADEYGGTQAGNLATFYAADALYRLEEYDRALTYYQQYEKDSDLFGASALAAEAAIYENQDQFQQAAETYEEAADLYESSVTTPLYLLNAGRAYMTLGDFESARRVLERVGADYPESAQAAEAEFVLARVKAMQAAQGGS